MPPKMKKAGAKTTSLEEVDRPPPASSPKAKAANMPYSINTHDGTIVDYYEVGPTNYADVAFFVNGVLPNGTSWEIKVEES